MLTRRLSSLPGDHRSVLASRHAGQEPIYFLPAQADERRGQISIAELTAQLCVPPSLEGEAEAEARAAEERRAQAQEAEELEAQAKALLERSAALKGKIRKQRSGHPATAPSRDVADEYIPALPTRPRLLTVLFSSPLLSAIE